MCLTMLNVATVRCMKVEGLALRDQHYNLGFHGYQLAALVEESLKV